MPKQSPARDKDENDSLNRLTNSSTTNQGLGVYERQEFDDLLDFKALE